MTRPTLRIAAAATATLLPLGVLAGCGQEDPEPTSEDPTSAGPSESDSKSPEEPVEPEPPAAMEKPNAAGAKAFVEYYFEALDYAQRTGDVELAERLALPDCVACAGSVHVITDAYENGGTISGGEFSVTRLRASAQGEFPRGGRSFAATANVATTKQVVRGSGDRQANGSYGAGSQGLQFLVAHSRDGWQMARWGAR